MRVRKAYSMTLNEIREAANEQSLMGKQFAVVQHHMKELHGAEKKVFETEGDFYCLIETGGSNSDHDEEVSCACHCWSGISSPCCLWGWDTCTCVCLYISPLAHPS